MSFQNEKIFMKIWEREKIMGGIVHKIFLKLPEKHNETILEVTLNHA